MSKHNYAIYETNDLVHPIHVFSASSPKRAVEKALVRETDQNIHEYVVRMMGRTWGTTYCGKKVTLKMPIVIVRGNREITIRTTTKDVRRVDDIKVYFENKKSSKMMISPKKTSQKKTSQKKTSQKKTSQKKTSQKKTSQMKTSQMKTTAPAVLQKKTTVSTGQKASPSYGFW
jgi:hypothetical protein